MKTCMNKIMYISNNDWLNVSVKEWVNKKKKKKKN